MNNFEILIRSEKVSDMQEVESVINQAFDGEGESKLVNRLRDKGALTFSLVAENKETQELVGHLSFSLVSIINDEKLEGKRARSWQALGLAPLSVIPKYQRQGVGSALINFWFEEYADDFYNAVFLLGDPLFYQRFGFIKALDFGLRWSEKDGEDFFQVKEIKKGFLEKVSGKVYYDEEFNRI